MRGLLVALTLLLPGSTALALAPPAVTAGIHPLEVTVGDRVQVHLTVRGLEPIGPPSLPSLESWGEAEVLEFGSFEPSSASQEGTSWQARVVITAFRPGPVELPPLPLRLAGEPTLTLETPESLGFTVVSVLPEGEEAQPMPPAPPRPLPGSALARALAVFALACALALALAALLWRRRRAAPVAPRPRMAPLPALLADLARLEGASSLEALHIGLSLALRRYLRASVGISALESTTTEIQRSLRATPLSSSLGQQLVELLRRCDHVKFARHQLTREESAVGLATARRLGQEIDRSLQAARRPPEVAA